MVAKRLADGSWIDVEVEERIRQQPPDIRKILKDQSSLKQFVRVMRKNIGEEEEEEEVNVDSVEEEEEVSTNEGVELMLTPESPAVEDALQKRKASDIRKQKELENRKRKESELFGISAPLAGAESAPTSNRTSYAETV